jgi:hypothetical protein
MQQKKTAILTDKAARLKSLLKKEPFVEGDIHLRLHRAISWLKLAEIKETPDDIKFISLWISFNSCYAIDNMSELNQAQKAIERSNIMSFLVKLVQHDSEDRIYNLLWNRYSSEIRLLMENKFIYKPFWEFHRGEQVDYQSLLEKSIVKANKALSCKQVPEVLELVLERLYTLRNQVFHGGSTYMGKANRQQLKDATSILGQLIPIIIEIMIEHKDEDWGKVHYPLVEV